ncbi:hypothetical protein MettiDRAFT_3021 [Methanolobus tindarius DSM 2278]|uniref:DUF3592 domain-containing protein n=1 Tax=Methanolobus tindarius DSM 2278 TaxID=1090322 RepID=W9DRU6_METTI|nr:hypothetical protein [Methanolobus tindarius]ETA69519.1 hypothetical protein MettiDRAFT_3021 [Methanolobus tindarius DSM 2278]
MEEKFNYYRIMSADYYSNLAVSSTLVFWVAYAIFYLLQFMPPDFMWRWKIITTSISVIAIIFLVCRIHFFYSVYMKGVDVTGYIHLANAYKSGGSRVEYKYEFQGEKYWRGNALTHKIFFSNNFREGDEVILRIDSENPKRAVIKDIYF